MALFNAWTRLVTIERQAEKRELSMLVDEELLTTEISGTDATSGRL